MACNCNDDMENKVWVGTMLKFLVTPTATGFDADTDDWQVEIRYGSLGKVYKVFGKEDLAKTNDGYIVVIDTLGMNGMVYAIITAWVHDSDCEDGLRREVIKVCLIEIKNV